MAYLHGIGRVLRSGTNRILRIKSKQVSYPILDEVAAVDGTGGPDRYGWGAGCLA